MKHHKHVGVVNGKGHYWLVLDILVIGLSISLIGCGGGSESSSSGLGEVGSTPSPSTNFAAVPPPPPPLLSPAQLSTTSTSSVVGSADDALRHISGTVAGNTRPCHQITGPSTWGNWSNFAPPYNVLSSDKEMILKANCDESGNIDIEAGNGSPLQYLYRDGYYYNGANWISYVLNGPPVEKTAVWFKGNATTTLTNPTQYQTQNGTYVVAYICTWTGTKWKCGCQDKTCETNHWNIQFVDPQEIRNRTIDLDITETPWVYAEQQDFGRDRLLEPDRMVQVLLEVVDVLSKTINIEAQDLCYMGSLETTSRLASQKFIELGLIRLARLIIEAPVGFISTGSASGDFLLKLGAKVLGSSFDPGTQISEDLLVFVVGESAGFVAGKAVKEYLATKNLVGAVTTELTETMVEEFLENDGVVVWQLGEGDNRNSDLYEGGLLPLAYVRATAYYNPYTRYTTLIIDADCENLKTLHIVRYEVEELEELGSAAKMVEGTLTKASKEVR